MNNKNSVLIMIIIAVVVAFVAFFAGMQYQKGQNNTLSSLNRPGATGRFRRFGGAAARNGNTPFVGQIISSDTNSITVKLRDGSSKIVLLSDSTPIMEATAAAKTALAVGKNVLVLGSVNSDGSITAKNISLNPQLRGG